MSDPTKPEESDFAAQAQESRSGLVAEFWGFLRENK